MHCIYLSILMQQPHDFASSKLLLTKMHTNLPTHTLIALMLGQGAHWLVMRCTVNRMLLSFAQSQQHHSDYGENNTCHAEQLHWHP